MRSPWLGSERRPQRCQSGLSSKLIDVDSDLETGRLATGNEGSFKAKVKEDDRRIAGERTPTSVRIPPFVRPATLGGEPPRGQGVECLWTLLVPLVPGGCQSAM
mmetsp:Transcript_97942/g.277039  ORF Transcript_97942/g.277039 Transcript_97942/m.277039 type:complete len:104 (-) Transcript_97942:178-489(-)